MIEDCVFQTDSGLAREQTAHGCHVGGLCTAVWILAEVGLFTSARATIHWKNTESFAEALPLIALTDTPFVLNENRSTTVAIDLVLDLITRLADRDIAIATSQMMLYGSIHKAQFALAMHMV
jgi:transcriptional regulator GlxA family with amidase domain